MTDTVEDRHPTSPRPGKLRWRRSRLTGCRSAAGCGWSGWRHVVAVVMVVWALFPMFYVISLSLSGGNTLTSACPPDLSGVEALSCLVPQTVDFSNYRRS